MTKMFHGTFVYDKD